MTLCSWLPFDPPAVDGHLCVYLHDEDGALYPAALRRIFDWYRRNDDGRYSARTKLRIAQAADYAGDALHDEERPLPGELPAVYTYEKSTTFDEETEVKSGGIIAATVLWPNDAWKMLVAVAAPYRRQGVGTALVRVLQYSAPNLTAWVNVENRGAQAFLLHNHFSPAQLNTAGGICYRRGASAMADDEGVEDGPPRSRDDNPSDPDDAPTRPSDWVVRSVADEAHGF